MRSLINFTLLTLISAHNTLSSGLEYDKSSFKPEDIITRDIVIIGGGSAGTHAAISLKDKGKSIIVIEQKGLLGGHTETYTDPATGGAVDQGVIAFHNISTVRDYFQRLNIPLVGNVFGTPRKSLDYDLRTGKQTNITRPSLEGFGAALQKYAGFLAQYPELDHGMFLPSPVPEDLVIPFGEFVTKYGVQDMVQRMFVTNQGAGDILSIPFVEIQRGFGLSLVQQFATGLVTTQRHNNSELYSAAQSELIADESLLLSSTVLDSARSEEGVELVVNTPEGKKLIRASKLLIAIPTHPTILKPFDLSDAERTIFEKFEWTNYVTSLVTDTGIPDDLFISNVAADTAYNLPPLPGAYVIQPTIIPGVKAIYYSTLASHSAFPPSEDEVKEYIVTALKRLQATNPTLYKQTDPKFVTFSSHAPFYARVGSEEIKSGFYDDLYKLQGQRSTWWTGATWRAQDSSMIWKYNEEVVIPGLLGETQS